MLKRLAPLASLLVALAAIVPSPPAHAADRTYTLCDPAVGSLCAPLVAYYKFEEAANSARTSETGSASFLEIAGANVATTNAHYADGAAGLDLSGGQILYMPRTPSLAGHFTIALWVKLDGTPSTLVPGQYLLRTMSGGVSWPQGSHLSFVASGGTITPRFTVQQTMTDDTTYVAAGSSYAVGTPGAWHHIAFGAYPSPTATEPYQTTIWMSLDAGTKTTATVTWPPKVALGDFQLYGLGNCTHTYVDAMAVFAGTLSPGELMWLKANPGYPFTTNPGT